ncbi:MAG TPA: hypothetical protein ENL03_03500, partial [Phycisphaerae bacterium]|nr:hypothetical protein [Phycisphaerae bacterium]
MRYSKVMKSGSILVLSAILLAAISVSSPASGEPKPAASDRVEKKTQATAVMSGITSQRLAMVPLMLNSKEFID